MTTEQRKQWRTLAESYRKIWDNCRNMLPSETDAAADMLTLIDAVLALTAEPEPGPVTREWLVGTLGEPHDSGPSHDHWRWGDLTLQLLALKTAARCYLYSAGGDYMHELTTREQIRAAKHLADTLQEPSP